MKGKLESTSAFIVYTLYPDPARIIKVSLFLSLRLSVLPIRVLQRAAVDAGNSIRGKMRSSAIHGRLGKIALSTRVIMLAAHGKIAPRGWICVSAYARCETERWWCASFYFGDCGVALVVPVCAYCLREEVARVDGSRGVAGTGRSVVL